MANEMRREVGGGTLAGRERILGNGERVKGAAGRGGEETLRKKQRKKRARTEDTE